MPGPLLGNDTCVLLVEIDPTVADARSAVGKRLSSLTNRNRSERRGR